MTSPTRAATPTEYTRVVRVAVALIILACAARADADPVSDAQALAAKNDFVGAAQKYREAFAASPQPDLLCNVGVAYYKAKDLPRAQRYLAQCLEVGTSLDAKFIANVKQVLGAVEQKLATADFTPVDLIVQPPHASVAIDGSALDEPVVGSRRVWLPYGRYRLTVHAEGHVDRVIDVDAKDRSAVRASVALERAQVEPTKPEPPKPEPQPEQLDVLAPPVVSQPRSKLVPVVATSATVGFAGGAVLAWLLARNKADDAGRANAEQNLDAYNEASDAAQRRQYIAWGLGGVAVVGAIASGYLWYRASVEVTPTSTTVSYVARF